MYPNKLISKDKLRFQLVLHVVLIIGGSWFAYVLPKRQIDTIKNEINIIDKKIAYGIDIARNLEPLRQECSQKHNMFSLMQKVLPTNYQTTEFLASVLHSARGLDIDFLSIGKPEIIAKDKVRT